MLFQHAYTTSPSCTPSCSALITGKYHWQLGTGANFRSTLPPEHESFVHLLRDRGYATGRNRAKSWRPGKIGSWQEVHGDHPLTTAYAGRGDFLDGTGAGEGQPFFFCL